MPKQDFDKHQAQVISPCNARDCSEVKPSKHLRCFFGNITTYGPTFKEFFAENRNSHDVWAVAEHHVPQHDIREFDKFVSSTGSKLISTSAEPTGRGGYSGGTAIITDPVVSAFDFSLYLSGSKASSNHCKAGATFAWIKRGPIDVLCITIYLLPSIGLTGINLERMQQWAVWIKSFSGPWLMMGDFNNEPIDLQCSYWMHYIQGVVKVPVDAELTCSSGQGRILDFVIVSKSLEPWITDIRTVNVPWKPHLALSFPLTMPTHKQYQRVQTMPWIPHLSTLSKQHRHTEQSSRDPDVIKWRAAVAATMSYGRLERSHPMQASVSACLFGVNGIEIGKEYASFITATEVFHLLKNPPTDKQTYQRKPKRANGPAFRIEIVKADVKSHKAVAERYRDALLRWWATQTSRLSFIERLFKSGRGHTKHSSSLCVELANAVSSYPGHPDGFLNGLPCWD